MTSEDALAIIRRAAMMQQLRILDHAHRRMRERRVRTADIEFACMVASRAVLQGNGRWRVYSTDLDDEELTVIAEIIPDIRTPVVVVTIF
jgi:molybdopterin-guanine dinucleotide biosynthesis protein